MCSTWVSVVCVQVIATTDACGVHGVDAERGELTTQLLDVTVLTIQSHLQLQTHLALILDQLKVRQDKYAHTRSRLEFKGIFPLSQFHVVPVKCSPRPKDIQY